MARRKRNRSEKKKGEKEKMRNIQISLRSFRNLA